MSAFKKNKDNDKFVQFGIDGRKKLINKLEKLSKSKKRLNLKNCQKLRIYSKKNL